MRPISLVSINIQKNRDQVYTVGSYLAIEKKAILSFASKQKDIIISERNKGQEKILIILAICVMLKYWTHKRQQDESDWILEMVIEEMATATKLPLDRRRAFWQSMMG